MLKILKSKSKILLGEASEPRNFFRNSFQRVIFEASAGGVKLTDTGFYAENAVAVGGNYSVGA